MRPATVPVEIIACASVVIEAHTPVAIATASADHRAAAYVLPAIAPIRTAASQSACDCGHGGVGGGNVGNGLVRGFALSMSAIPASPTRFDMPDPSVEIVPRVWSTDAANVPMVSATLDPRRVRHRVDRRHAVLLIPRSERGDDIRHGGVGHPAAVCATRVLELFQHPRPV